MTKRARTLRKMEFELERLKRTLYLGHELRVEWPPSDGARKCWMRKRSMSSKVVGQIGQLRRYRVRLTKRENAAIKKLARRHDALPPKTLGVAYDIEMLKKILEDVEIYVDEIYRQSPKKIIEEAVETTVHEICHKEGLNEEQATIATDILMKDKKLKHSLAERTKRALKESKILGQLMTWRCPETRKK